MNPFLLGAVGWYGMALILIGPMDTATPPPVAAQPLEANTVSCERITDLDFLDCLAQGFGDGR